MARLLCVLVGLLLALPSFADDNAKLFGKEPQIESLSMSPNGRYIAFLRRDGDKTGLIIRDLQDMSAQPVMTNVSGIKVRGVEWANDRFVLLHVSKTTHSQLFRTELLEFGAVFSFDRQTGKIEQLLIRERSLAPNSNLGRVIGVLPGENTVLMPAFRKTSTDDREYVLFRVDMEKGFSRLHAKGFGNATRQFIVDPAGNAIARVNYVAKLNQYKLQAYREKQKRWETIVETSSEQLPFGIQGLAADGENLLVTGYMDGDTRSLYEISLADGSIHGPILTRKGADLETVTEQVWENRPVGGGFADVSGTQYEFIDKNRQAIWEKIKARLPGILIEPISWSRDDGTWLLYAYDETSAGKYVIYHAKDDDLSILAGNRDDIPSDKVAREFTLKFKATDGTPLTGVLTTPPGFEKGPVPMVVLPHGGPTSHDSVGWDYMAQYLANEGYLVLQPNYRGSDGFGSEFEYALDGNWGSMLMDDINQGARAMIKAGYADADRICIAGASFGGYAALMGVTLMPGPYKCAISIAGMSDLQQSLNHTSRTYGYESISSEIWRERMLGPDKSVKPDSISPAKHAEQAMAPILMIHGKDDTVVPYEQSLFMRRALDQAGKPVEMVTLKGEDHWLSSEDTRIETLSAMGDFLRKYLHNATGPQSASISDKE